MSLTFLRGVVTTRGALYSPGRGAEHWPGHEAASRHNKRCTGCRHAESRVVRAARPLFSHPCVPRTAFVGPPVSTLHALAFVLPLCADTPSSPANMFFNNATAKAVRRRLRQLRGSTGTCTRRRCSKSLLAWRCATSLAATSHCARRGVETLRARCDSVQREEH